ncbi:MAG: hypothetical protein WD270_09365 [Acetobacterales bacterium]
MTELRILGTEDVRRLITHEEALDLADTVFADVGRGRARLSRPSAQWLDIEEGAQTSFKIKGATVPAASVAGFRLLAKSKPGGTPAVCNYTAIYSHDTGRLIGLVDESWLSRLRTAAMGVAACRMLAPPSVKAVALFGTGQIASEAVPLLNVAFPPEEVRVLSRRPESTKAFVERKNADMPFSVRAGASGEDMVKGADIVIALTESKDPLVKPGWLKPGAVLCPLGSYNEVDFAVLAECDRFILDDMNYALEIGDLCAWVRQGHIDAEGAAARVDTTVGEVACGKAKGRTTPDQRILAIVQGIAAGDVMFGAHVLKRAAAEGVGAVVDLP